MTGEGSAQGKRTRAGSARSNAGRILTELGDTRLFDGLDDKGLTQLAAISRRLVHDTGQTVFSQGDRATAFYLLVRGQVKVYKLMRDGRTATLRYVRPGETFAESALTLDHYPAYTETTAPCVIYRFPIPEFRALMLDHPELALAVLVRTTQLMALLNRRVEELLLPVPARLARFLLELCDEQLRPPPGIPYRVDDARQPAPAPAPIGTAAPNAGGGAPSRPAAPPASGPRICRLPMTKRDLAARLGTVPETLSRALGGLKRTGIIRLSGNGELVEVLDFNALTRIAQF